MRGNLLACAAACAALVAAPAASEVRLVDAVEGVLEVEISTTPRGPWTPEGAITSRVLNPSGDLFGDGMPGWDSRGTSVLSAWIRPGSGLLNQSIGRGAGWTPLPSIVSPGAHGQPIVDVLAQAWSVTWQAEGAVLVGATALDGAMATPLLVGRGLLVGTIPGSDRVHVVTLEGDQLWSTTVALAFVPTQPIPIQLRIVSRILLRGSALAPISGSRHQVPERFTPGHPRVLDVARDGGAPQSVVVWREARSLAGILVGEDGPLLPVRSVLVRAGEEDLPGLLGRLGAP